MIIEGATTRRRWGMGELVVVAVYSLLPWRTIASAGEDRTNIVLIYTDDQDFDEIGR